MEIASLVSGAPILGVVGLVVALGILFAVRQMPAGNELMKELAGAIHKGAMVFLRREYSLLLIFIIIVAGLLGTFITPWTAIAFVTGAAFSMAAGFIGMQSATAANVRTAAIVVPNRLPLGKSMIAYGDGVGRGADGAVVERRLEKIAIGFGEAFRGVDAAAVPNPDFIGLADERRGRGGVEELANLERGFPRKPYVVGVQKGDPFSPSVADGEVSGGGDAQVFLAEKADGDGAAVRPRSDFFERAGRAVGRPVVDNDEFEGAVVLGENGVDGAADGFRAVVYGYDG